MKGGVSFNDYLDRLIGRLREQGIKFRVLDTGEIRTIAPSPPRGGGVCLCPLAAYYGSDSNIDVVKYVIADGMTYNDGARIMNAADFRLQATPEAAAVRERFLKELVK